MKILVSWLKDYIQTDLTPDEIADTLRDMGLPNEGIDYLDGGDAIIDVEVTSNRGDCLSYIGMARELSAATGAKLSLPEIKLQESELAAADSVQVTIDEPTLCCRYTAMRIDGVKVGPSPDWVVRRLEAAGLRSVNNVVDATNYAMLETGQPPHAFDLDKISNCNITVRKAIPGERIVSIDGSKCDLEPDMLIIADPRGPVAIAGVMGGLDTEVSDTTTSILLEDAYFDPVSVRTTSRRLSLPSDAAYRFERHVDIRNIDWAARRTAQLITEFAGGKVAHGIVDAYPTKPAVAAVDLRLERMSKLLGIQIPADEASDILAGLGFQPTVDGGVIRCTIPSWRRTDVQREADLIEEVARVYGYDKVPTEKKIRIEIAPIDARQKLLNKVCSYLNSCGFYETVNVTFTDRETAALFAPDDEQEHLGVKDVSRKSANLLRQTVLGSLLNVLKTNLNAKNSPCRVFEVSDTFVPGDKSSLPIERAKIGLVCDSDLRTLKGAVEGLLCHVLKDCDMTFSPVDMKWAQASASIEVNGTVVGSLGIAGDIVMDKFGFKDVSVSCAEIDFESIAQLQGAAPTVKPIPRFPSIERDLSLLLDEDMTWSAVESVVLDKAPAELEDIRFVDLYRGKGIPQGKKSLTLSLLFRDDEGTLTHEAVDQLEKVIVENLIKTVDAELRTA